MTKAELIELLDDYPDEIEVFLWASGSHCGVNIAGVFQTEEENEEEDDESDIGTLFIEPKARLRIMTHAEIREEEKA